MRAPYRLNAAASALTAMIGSVALVPVLQAIGNHLSIENSILQPARFLAPVTFSEVVFGTSFDVLIFGDISDLIVIGGIVCILGAGVYVVRGPNGPATSTRCN